MEGSQFKSTMGGHPPTSVWSLFLPPTSLRRFDKIQQAVTTAIQSNILLVL
jgi:hypothetical protein